MRVRRIICREREGEGEGGEKRRNGWREGEGEREGECAITRQHPCHRRR